MRNLCFFILLFCASFYCTAQIVDIPDPNFKNRLTNFPCIDTDGDGFGDSDADLNDDGEIQVSEAELVSRIIIGSGANITSVEGLQSFVNLEKIQFTNNDITEFPIENLVNLVEVIVWGTNLTSLNVNNLTSLEILNCEDNAITELQVNNAVSLINLDCAGNEINSLEVSGLSNLVTLNSHGNNLTSLDVSGLTNLRYLYTGNNALTTIDTQDASNIEYFSVGINQLTSIEISHMTNLYLFDCAQNPLTTLSFEASNSNITQLTCQNSSLQSLDVSNLPNLEYFNAGYNNLTSIDLTNQSNLIELSVRDNLLEQIFIKNGVDNTELTGSSNVFPFINNPTLEYVCVDESEKDYMEWRFGLVDFDNVEVNTYCSFEPGGRNFFVFGETKIDVNQDGCDDSDPNFPNLMFNINNGNDLGNTSANQFGFHEIPFTEGSYTITPINLNVEYYTVTPQSFDVVFEENDSSIEQGFCVTPLGTFNDLEITIVPLNQAVPGFDAEYKLIYRNKGTTVLDGTIDFNYSASDQFLTFLEAIPVATSNTDSELTWSFSSLLPQEAREIFVSFNLNTPIDPDFPLNSGDELGFSGIIYPVDNDETPSDNQFELKQIVVNSFDPNDKVCLQGPVVFEDSIGEYVHYRIRFENLGTANATNIVVRDIINLTEFDISSLVVLDASHDMYTRINNGNEVEFIFENIQLPFDDTNNDGYIVYKIKILNSLQVDDTFSNQAEIYFDFNAPIFTNVYTTTIKSGLSVNEFSELDIQLYPNPSSDVVTITSKQVMDSVSIYDIKGRLVEEVGLNSSNIIFNIDYLQSGVYFVKVTSDNLTETLKFVKK